VVTARIHCGIRTADAPAALHQEGADDQAERDRERRDVMKRFYPALLRSFEARYGTAEYLWYKHVEAAAALTTRRRHGRREDHLWLMLNPTGVSSESERVLHDCVCSRTRSRTPHGLVPPTLRRYSQARATASLRCAIRGARLPSPANDPGCSGSIRDHHGGTIQSPVQSRTVYVE
jgi:hypothetical protein